MEPSYNVWADGLAKFHTASAPVQALWIIAGTVLAGLALHCLTTIVVTALRRVRDPGIELVYGICRDKSGRLMVYPEVKDEGQPALPGWRDKVH